MAGRSKQPVGIFKPAGSNTIDPDRKRGSKRSARFVRRADKIRNRRATCLDDPVAHPAHPAGMLDPVGWSESKVSGEIGAYGVRVENDGIEERRQSVGKRCLSR